MALIGKIRNNMWAVFIIIALALLSFILMDSMGPGGGQGMNANQAIGTVNGEKLKQMDFERTYSTLFNNASDPNVGREALWNYFVEKSIADSEAEALGMAVGRDELMDLQFGSNLSPIIYQNFANPQTGQLDVARLQQIKNQLESGEALNNQFATYWAEQEKQIKTTQIQTKLSNMVSKAYYTPNWLAQSVYKEENSTADIAVVKIPFDNIPAEGITVSDSDISAYAADHKSEYELKEEMRVVDYITYDVYPTDADSTQWRNKTIDMMAKFKTASNDSLYAFSNNGFYSPLYGAVEQFDEFYRERLGGYEVGEVYGPHQLGNNYQAIKIIDKKILPDSVKAAHILKRVTPGNAEQLEEANRIVDSLMTVLSRNKSKFAELAGTFSEDLSNKEDGGDLGYFAQGSMVGPFNQVAFHTGKENNLYKVQTQFGVHLLYIKDQKFETREPKYKVAYVSTPIIPSKATESDAYDAMLTIVGEYQYLSDVKEAVKSNPALRVETSENLPINGYTIGQLGGGSTSRDIVKFAFDSGTEVNDVSPNVFQYTDPIRYYTNKYVIAGLSDIKKAGMPPVSDLRNELEFTVLNQLKGKKAVSSISGSNLSSIASTYNVSIDTVNSVNMLNNFVAGLGNEPSVIGAAFSQEVGSVSAPILGNSGVFVVKTLSKNDAGEVSGLAAVKKAISQEKKTSGQYGLMKALRDNVKVEDNRSVFY